MLKVLLLVAVVAIALYLLLRTLDRRATKGLTRQPPRTIAPDDDIDFLRDIERKQRHKDEPPQLDEP